MSLRPPSTPHASGSAAPGTPSALPTPASRRRSLLPARPPSSQAQLGRSELASLRQAVLRNDPAKYDSPQAGTPQNASKFTTAVDHDADSDSPSPADQSAAQPTTPLPARRPPSAVANRRQSLAPGQLRPTTPSSLTMPRPRTPNAFRSSVSGQRPPSRLGATQQQQQQQQSKASNGLDPGDAVTFEVAGQAMQGTLRFIGPVDGKPGQWAGVELDIEWHGKGKNDGSVKGVQYFACEPLCGLFLPLAKVTRVQPPLPPVTPIASKITAGSRASKYLGMTASDLATKRRVSLAPTQTSPTKSTARRSASPEKPASAAGAPSLATPRATRARPSIGGPGAVPVSAFATPRRASLAPGATPRATLASSVKRPPSSLRVNAPDVPPVPSNYTLNRSVTPSSTSGRQTPSTPGLGPNRRTSLATESLGASTVSRPTTPSFRSASRQSFASSVSRSSFRSVSNGTGPAGGVDNEVVDELRKAVDEANERELATRKMLEGSERLGREMEDSLAERDAKLRELSVLVEALQAQTKKQQEQELARAAGLEQEEADDKKKIIELEQKLVEVVRNEASTKATLDRLRKEWENKFAAKESENESLRERMSLAVKNGEDERLELTRQLDQLRSAGQALCETYEERIADIENGRLEALERVDNLQQQLEQARNDRMDPATDKLSLSSSQIATTSAADIIDAENAKAEADHLRAKLVNLEEQLEATKMQLESESERAEKIKVKGVDMEQSLRRDVDALKKTLDGHKEKEAKAAARVEELEEALLDSQVRLEEERAELETLRRDASGGGATEELAQAHKQIAILKTERQAAQQTSETLRQEIDKHLGHVEDLKEEVRSLERDLDQVRLANRALQDTSRHDSIGSLSSPARGFGSTQVQGSPIRGGGLSPVQDRRRDSLASSSSRQSFGGKDEVTAQKDQIVGLKAIVQSLEQENAELADKNKVLMAETTDLRDRQSALEAKAERLVANGSTGPATPTAAEIEHGNVDNTNNDVLESSLRRELDELRSKLEESEKRSQREITALNQEVSELESLVESKIYREDELETELRKFKALAASVTSNPQPSSGHERTLSSASSVTSQSSSKRMARLDDDDGVGCEMCGEMGHDLDACPIFAGSASPTKAASSKPARPSSNDSQDFCDDCEEYGHSLEDCPVANEIF
ncbi:hypothetical protein OIV83_001132 [Microbotryomycetes sp. JL201]|nr:hypothetical protein OIV83_001132 [Microbotryomycetes sp. JL201]